MPPIDHSAEYYRLREGHERALALAAPSESQRNGHLAMAARYGELARRDVPPFSPDLSPADRCGGLLSGA
jgi:hypothetical protein